MPSNVRSPPAAIVNSPVLVIDTPPLPAVFIVSLIVKAMPLRSIPPTPVVDTAPLKVVVPLPAVWVRLTASKALTVTSAALLIVTASRSVVAPTTPENPTSPVPAVNAKSKPPSNVSLKLISPVPAPPVDTAIAPVSVVALSNVMLAPVVITSPAVFKVPLRFVPKLTVPVVVVISPAAATEV